ncbi:hypothetical protein NDU88_001903 [Pleurodeles waltl]|uniref:Transposase n=1 Tax=Pleurodeles waltl TaxID=8319 RepID=A0AAV7RAE1_PLEWA|nr:hypothetical protein NDU88_001903 [Pleurodeles waltl]
MLLSLQRRLESCSRVIRSYVRRRLALANSMGAIPVERADSRWPPKKNRTGPSGPAKVHGHVLVAALYCESISREGLTESG